MTAGNSASADAAQGQNLAEELRLDPSVGRRLDRGMALWLVLAFVPLVVVAILAFVTSH